MVSHSFLLFFFLRPIQAGPVKIYAQNYDKGSRQDDKVQ